jgi:hypothetical protein
LLVNILAQAATTATSGDLGYAAMHKLLVALVAILLVLGGLSCIALLFEYMTGRDDHTRLIGILVKTVFACAIGAGISAFLQTVIV